MKYFYYESAIDLPALSDREEARRWVEKAVRGLEAIGSRKASQEDDLKEARETLRSFR